MHYQLRSFVSLHKVCLGFAFAGFTYHKRSFKRQIVCTEFPPIGVTDEFVYKARCRCFSIHSVSHLSLLYCWKFKHLFIKNCAPRRDLLFVSSFSNGVLPMSQSFDASKDFFISTGDQTRTSHESWSSFDVQSITARIFIVVWIMFTALQKRAQVDFNNKFLVAKFVFYLDFLPKSGAPFTLRNVTEKRTLVLIRLPLCFTSSGSNTTPRLTRGTECVHPPF